jgi:hypothetical protein
MIGMCFLCTIILFYFYNQSSSHRLFFYYYEAQEGPQQPTTANAGQRKWKRAQTTIGMCFLCTIILFYFDNQSSSRRLFFYYYKAQEGPQQPTTANAGQRKWKRAQTMIGMCFLCTIILFYFYNESESSSRKYFFLYYYEAQEGPQQPTTANNCPAGRPLWAMAASSLGLGLGLGWGLLVVRSSSSLLVLVDKVFGWRGGEFGFFFWKSFGCFIYILNKKGSLSSLIEQKWLRCLFLNFFRLKHVPYVRLDTIIQIEIGWNEVCATIRYTKDCMIRPAWQDDPIWQPAEHAGCHQ